jgi:GT2 family glycosyltransferase
MAGLRIAAIMAVYNRRDLTLACLDSLRAQQLPGGTLDVFVPRRCKHRRYSGGHRRTPPRRPVASGDGQQYWNGGMRRAFREAMAGDYDYYLWMNDDTMLDDGVVALLLKTERELRERGHGPVIVAGTTRHPETGELTYGGQIRPSRWRRLAWTLVEPGAEPRPSETMNGNTVLIPRAVVQLVGNIDPSYVQQMGDLDYGLRARAAGCEVWVGPRHDRHLRLTPRAAHRPAAATARASPLVVDQGACAQALAGVHAALGRALVAHLLA